MMQTTRWAGTLVSCTVLSVHGLIAQQPTQFKANVKTRDGSDGTSAAGVMYFGGAKVRMELAKDGQNIVVLADPAAKTQYILMPSEKMYMQMPIGQGPINVHAGGTTDPTNPCSNPGAADCVKGPMETVNGYETVRWDYTSQDGTRTRAWVSTKLRFAIKTTDDNGSLTELSEVAIGAQPASLFAIPAGYTKMDVGAMGGMGATSGRAGARGNSENPVAAAMRNMSPEAAAAMAAAMRGEAPKGTRGPTGSAWEKGKGWILGVTITGTVTTNKNGERGNEQSTYSAKYTGSIPLNLGSPALGTPGAPGPMWNLLVGAPGSGSREAEAAPLTLSLAVESTYDRVWKSDCKVHGETGWVDPGNTHATMKGSFQKSVPITQQSTELMGQGYFKMSGDLKTYDLLIGIGGAKLKEVTQTHTETIGCFDKKVQKSDTTATSENDYTLPAFELKGLPLPATVSTISGSKKLPLRFGTRDIDATVNWTLTPIR